MLDEIRSETLQALMELQQAANLGPGQVLVIGASSSEIMGSQIGTSGSTDAAQAVVDAIFAVRDQFGFDLAFQCCEHLNRALVVSRQSIHLYGWEEVSVIPVPHAGGSVAAAAFGRFLQPAVVESVKAHAGIDIGDTLIGMHLRPVAVPVRPTIKQIGQAHVTMARTRPKLIGGSRAVYDLDQIKSLRDSTSSCT